MMSPISLFVLSLLWDSVSSKVSFEDGSDLAAYTSRPDLRPPLFNITWNEPGRVTPGYWFVAPYKSGIARITPEFRPHQIGPHIYDQNGELVWSGAAFDNYRDTFDFKVSGDPSQNQLSFLLYLNPLELDRPGSTGIVMNSNYTTSNSITEAKADGDMLDLHELSLTDNNRNAIYVATKGEYEAPVRNEDGSYSEFRVMDNIIKEKDLTTGQILFEWSALDHISLNESTYPRLNDTMRYPPWDFLHMNSVQKVSNGDYVISARHTNAIYRVSGEDGRIIWRLGGTRSSFQQDFNFSGQHDARVHSSNETTTVISFLDNASNNITSTAEYSRALLVALDISTMTANVIKKWDRPDHKLTHWRGSVQLLPNGHAFICWSENAQLTEHDNDGELVLRASFLSKRFTTYRGFKFNFTGNPIEPPRLVAQVYGTSCQTRTTIVYVSWNGDTRTSVWQFYGAFAPSGRRHYVGSTARSGFEASFQFAEYYPHVIAEAVDGNGNSLRNSSAEAVVTMPGTVTLFCDQEESRTPVLEAVGFESSDSILTLLNVAMVLVPIAMGTLLFARWRRRRKRHSRTRKSFEESLLVGRPV